jgi:hypothetical protein
VVPGLLESHTERNVRLNVAARTYGNECDVHLGLWLFRGGL